MDIKESTKLCDQAFETLYEDVCAGKSDGLKRYMKLMATFHNYSYYNTILIMMQKPDATRVAGFNKWKTYNCFVKKGEKGIAILAPRVSKFKEIEGQRIYLKSNEDGDDVKINTSFFPVHVFDISQVEGELPEDIVFFKNMGNDYKTMYLKLLEIIKSNGVSIKETNSISAQGTSIPGKIYIKQTLDYNNKLTTLIHEYAHEILHQRKKDGDNFSREEEECQAESVSYVVSAYLGFENTLSKDYVVMWGATKENFIKVAAIVKKGSEEIINMIEKGTQNVLS